eukprot:7479545-Lingulodinium_polyedra.AAC.1
METGRQLWYVTEKNHYAQHVGIDLLATKFNPRFGWTYADEDYVGRIAQTARACTRANGPLRMPSALHFRYRNLMYLRWQRRLGQASGSS